MLQSPDGKHIVLVSSPKQDFLNCKKTRHGTWNVECNHLNLNMLGGFHKLAGEIKPLKYPDARLHEYQVRDIQRMVSQKHIMNSNRMGYGKTVETIKTLQEVGAKNILILAPKPVLWQWEKEFNEWWPEHPSIQVRKTPTLKNPGIVILNYECLLTEKILIALRSVNWDAIVCDESHRIKNRKSRRWTEVSSLPGKRKICLTGTPILNKVDDLWAQLHWLDWRYVGRSYWEFVEHFMEVEDGQFGKEIGKLRQDHADQLKYIVDLACIQNPDLKLTPGKTRHTVDLQMDTRQKKLYKDAQKLIWESLPETLTITNSMTHLLRLRQITSAPEQHDPACTNAKLDWLQQQVEDNPDTKFVVYTNWVCALEQIEKRLQNQCALYHGSMHQDSRKAALEMFKFGTRQVLAGTIGALGTGVDGLQHVAHHVVFFDRDWSPEINEQAEDRVNRQGQKNPVHVYYLECIGTVDRHVSKLNLSKEEDIRQVLKGDSNEPAGENSRSKEA